MLSAFIDNLIAYVAKIKFDYLIAAVWGSYAAIFLAALVLTVASAKIKTASKRPFLCLTNAYAGVNLALFITRYTLTRTIFISAAFWFVGYLLYGFLCLLTKEKEPVREVIKQTVLTSAPAVPNSATVPASVPLHASLAASPATVPLQPSGASAPRAVSASKSNVRLDHAVSVTDKLLSKNLGKGDRQELEKLRNTLAVLQIKGTLSPTESEILNENFNTLLKLMAKYNV